MTEAEEQRIRQSLAQFLETSNASRREIAGEAEIDNSQLGRFLNKDGSLSDEKLENLKSVLDKRLRRSKSIIPEATLHELASALRDGCLTLFVGAGLSRQGLPPPGKKPLPLWGELTAGLAREIVGADALEGLDGLSPVEQLDYLQALGHRDKVERLMREQFLNDARYRPSPAHEILAKLPWKTIITTNYDGLLSQVLDVRFPVVTERDFHSHDPRSIRLIHLNGDLREPHTLFSGDFHDWAARHPRAHSFLESAVSPPNRVLFVGYSFSDPFLIELLARVRELSSREGFQNVIHAWMWRLDPPKKIILRSRYNVEAQVIHHDGEWEHAFAELLAAYEKIGGASARGAQPAASQDLRRRFHEIQRHAHARANLSGLYVGEAYRGDDVLLEHVFVEPSLCFTEDEASNPARHKNLVASRNSADREDQFPMDGRGCRPALQWLDDAKSRLLVILGDPGTGKTSLLQTRLLACLAEWETNAAATFPIFLRLSIWEKDCPPLKTLLDYAQDFIAAQLGVQGAELLRPWLTAGPVHWLLDGVDEVRDSARRATLLDELETLQKHYPRHRWTVTSRPSGYRAEARLPASWQHVELAPLDNTQGRALLAKWAALLQKLHKLPRPYYEPDELFADLGSQTGLSPLRRNPLLLTMIVLFYRDSYRLPKDRWEFYTHATQSLRMRWARHRSGMAGPDPGRVVDTAYYDTLLPHLAIEAMKGRTAVLSRVQLRDMLATVLKWHNYTGREVDDELNSFFSDAIALIGVFVEKGLDRFGFLHLTFQEYYAAVWLIAHEKEAAALMRSHGLDPDWQEVWELYVLGLGINGDKLDALHEAVGGKPDAMNVRLHWLGLGSAPFPKDEETNTARQQTLTVALKALSGTDKKRARATLASWEREYHPKLRTALTALINDPDNERAHAAAKALGEQTEGRELRAELLRMLCGSDARQRGFAEYALMQKADSPRVKKDLLALYHGSPPEGISEAPSTAARAAAARALGGGVPAVQLWGPLPPEKTKVVQLNADTTITFVLIEPGSVRGEDKKLIKIDKPFWLAQTQVTQAQWRAVMGEDNNPANFKGDHLPVEQVSWNAIAKEDKEDHPQTFNARLTALNAFKDAFGEQHKTRLPEEKEWEYACRAGTTTWFHYGDSLGSEQANIRGSHPDGGAKDGVYRERTVVVGSFEPNAFGLHDMHGNVWEWCDDEYDVKEKSHRVMRGGGFFNFAEYCRSSFRSRGTPGVRYLYLGFRPAVSSVSSKAGGKK